MKEKKDQYIIAYIADFNETDTVVSYAVHLAQRLNKGLILMHICDADYSKLSTSEAETRLMGLQRQVSLNAGGIAVTYAALHGKTTSLIEALPTLLGAVAIVVRVDRKAPWKSPLSRRSILKNFANSRAAFLVAQEPLANPARMQDVAFAVDFKKESKDKFIWSSYFPRFGGSRMHVLYYDYKDEFLRNKWYANMKQFHKLYTDLDITFTPHIIESKSTYQDINALRYAAAEGYGLFIAVTTKEKDGLEFFIGVQEQRTIANSYGIPILFLNPRDDLYVLCD